MWFHNNPTKRELMELGCFTWHFHWCVWHIIFVLNLILMIIPILLIGLFFELTLINNYIFTWWAKKIFMKLPCNTNIYVRSWNTHCHLCVILFWIRNLHWWYKHWLKTFFCINQTIYELSDILWCSNTMVYDYILCMFHNLD